MIAPVIKKGTGCSNHRGIRVIRIFSKASALIILRRLTTASRSKIREKQARFHLSLGCVDRNFTLKQLLEKRHIDNRNLLRLSRPNSAIRYSLSEIYAGEVHEPSASIPMVEQRCTMNHHLLDFRSIGWYEVDVTGPWNGWTPIEQSAWTTTTLHPRYDHLVSSNRPREVRMRYLTN